MSEDGKKPYISHSSLSLFETCGEAWRRRYIMKERYPSGLAALRGISVHKAAELNFTGKIQSHEDLPVKDVVDIAASEFDTRLGKEGVWLNHEEESTGRDIVVGAAKDTTVRLADLAARQMFPKHQPVAVEIQQRIEIGAATHDILGRVDLVNDKDQIVDTKSSARVKSQADIDTSQQFSLYSLAHRARFGRDPAGIVIENLVDTKEPKLVTLMTKRGMPDYQVLINRINAMLAAVAAGIFLPSAAGSWKCSKKFCEYWSTCPYVQKGLEKPS